MEDRKKSNEKFKSKDIEMGKSEEGKIMPKEAKMNQSKEGKFVSQEMKIGRSKEGKIVSKEAKMGGSEESKAVSAEEANIDQSEESKTPVMSRVFAGFTALLVIGIVLATIVSAFMGASQNLVFTLIFLGVAISAIMYGFLLMNRFLRARRNASLKNDEKSDLKD